MRSALEVLASLREGVERPDSAYPLSFCTFGLLKRLNRDMLGFRGP